MQCDQDLELSFARYLANFQDASGYLVSVFIIYEYNTFDNVIYCNKERDMKRKMSNQCIVQFGEALTQIF